MLLLADDLLKIIESIHNKYIIHRDLKPENILIGLEKEDNNIYLVDFGISKVYRENGMHTEVKVSLLKEV